MLQVEHLSVSYGESEVLKDVTLQVNTGQVVCVLGRNGVGKTTLLKAIMGVLKPRAGRILVAGQDLTHRSSSYRARTGIGYVPQGRGIFPYLTVHENLLVGLEARADRKQAPDALSEVFDIFPVLEQMRARDAGMLSGGQQQQLALARALVGQPKLLILDEPTEGIQPSLMLELEEVILRLRQRGTMAILLVEQFLDFALNVGDYHYIMETGAIATHGPIDHLHDATIREYLVV